MSYKIHGTSAPGQHLSLTMDFYMVTTAVNIIPTGVVGDASQVAFDTLVQIVSLNGQPIIAELPTVASNVYTFKFAIDHTGSWTDAPTLVTALKTLAPNVFGADATLAVTIASSY